MEKEKDNLEKVLELDDLAMDSEISVCLFSSGNYLNEFHEWFEIRNRDHKLKVSTEGFYEELKDLCGRDVYRQLADKTVELFGLPERIMRFEDDTGPKEELEGPDGLAPFFFVFDMMFCEYKDLTLFFISGTNN
ncbi:MAG: hypothetical protein IKE38_05785 [Erysipelotrichaceae bacterium]|nr:hypothetical protein [Erysipelotrichaceae bacterium]